MDESRKELRQGGRLVVTRDSNVPEVVLPPENRRLTCFKEIVEQATQVLDGFVQKTPEPQDLSVDNLQSLTLKIFEDVMRRNMWQYTSDFRSQIDDERIQSEIQRALAQYQFREKALGRIKSIASRLKPSKGAYSTERIAQDLLTMEAEDIPRLEKLPSRFDEEVSEQNLKGHLLEQYSTNRDAIGLQKSRVAITEAQIVNYERSVAQKFSGASINVATFKDWLSEYQPVVSFQNRVRALKSRLESERGYFREGVIDSVNDSAHLLLNQTISEYATSDVEIVVPIDTLSAAFEEQIIRRQVERYFYPRKPDQVELDEQLEQERQLFDTAQNPQRFTQLLRNLETQRLRPNVEQFTHELTAALEQLKCTPEEITRRTESFQKATLSEAIGFKLFERVKNLGTEEGIAKAVLDSEDVARWSVLRKMPEIRQRYSSEFIDLVDKELFKQNQTQVLEKFEDKPIDNLTYFDSPDSIKTTILLMLGEERNHSWGYSSNVFSWHRLDEETMDQFARTYAHIPQITEFVNNLKTGEFRYGQFDDETMITAADFLVAIASDQKEIPSLRKLAFEGLRHNAIPAEKSGSVLTTQYTMTDELEIKLGIITALKDRTMWQNDRNSAESLIHLYDIEQDPEIKVTLALSLKVVVEYANRRLESEEDPQKQEVYQLIVDEVKTRFLRDIKAVEIKPEQPFENAALTLGMVSTLSTLGLEIDERTRIVGQFFAHARRPETNWGGFYDSDEEQMRANIYDSFLKEARKAIPKANYEQLTSIARAYKETTKSVYDIYDMREFLADLFPRLYELSSAGEPIPLAISNSVALLVWRLTYEEKAMMSEDLKTQFPQALDTFLEVLYRHNLSQITDNAFGSPTLFFNEALAYLVAEPQKAIVSLNALIAETSQREFDSDSIKYFYLDRIFKDASDLKIRTMVVRGISSFFQSDPKVETVNMLLSLPEEVGEAKVKNEVIEALIKCRKYILSDEIEKRALSPELLGQLRSSVSDRIKQKLLTELENFSVTIDGIDDNQTTLFVCETALNIIDHFDKTKVVSPDLKKVLLDVFRRVDALPISPGGQVPEETEQKSVLEIAERLLINTIDNYDIEEVEEITNIFERRTKPDRMFVLFKSISPKLAQEIRRGNALKRSITDPFMRAFRAGDYQLPEDTRRNIPEDTFERFLPAIENLVSAAEIGGELYSFREEILSQYVLRFIARQPERISEITKLPRAVPKLFEYLVSGPLQNVRGQVLKYILSNGDIVGRAKVFETAFSHKVPYWTQLFVFTESVIGPELAAATSEYPIRTVPKIMVPMGAEAYLAQETAGDKEIDVLRFHNFRDRSIAEMSVKEKRALVSDNFAELDDGQVAQLTEIPFVKFKGIIKKTIWLKRLKETVEFSRDEELKATADKRNRKYAISKLEFDAGTYIHGAPLLSDEANVLDYVLTSGNLPVEALGEDVGKDSYPFHVDFSVLTQDYLESHPSVQQAVAGSISHSFGIKGTLGENGQLIFVYNREPESYDQGITHTTKTSSTHGLILGGMPSTEISAIVLRNPEWPISSQEKVLDKVKKSIIEAGFYIPVYDLEGNLIFSTQEYDEIYTVQNCQIPIGIIDYAHNIGEKLGSNPGATYLVPGEQEPRRCYVKYATTRTSDKDSWEAQSRIWNEYLADRIYQEMGIAVPKTNIVKIRDLNLYGHASDWLEGTPDESISRKGNYKDGAVVDWFLANWDAQHDKNLRSISGVVYRVDNGGALLFRAQGERRSGFGPIVTETETMQSAYTDLTKEEIIAQVARLKEVMTDLKIDELVGSTRLSDHDRDYLKTTLKARRDYLTSYFRETTETAEALIIPARGGEVVSDILDWESKESALVAEIPELAKLLGEEGYQHNKVLLGKHIKEAVVALQGFKEFRVLNPEEQNLAIVAMLFHDFGKPTGKVGIEIPRDFDHEIPSATLAAQYMNKWGYSQQAINMVIRVIINDGVVSDIARDKVKDSSKQYSSEQFAKVIGNREALRILRLVNRADVIATVGEAGYQRIQAKYEAFFNETERNFL